MTKTFHEISKTIKEYVENATIIADGPINYFTEFATKFSGTFQPSVKQALNKVEVELNKFGYSLGELDLDGISDEEKGDEDFLIVEYSSGEIVKNLYFNFEWNRVSGQQFDYTSDGSKLMYDVKMKVIRISPDEMESILGSEDDALEDVAEEVENITEEKWIFQWKQDDKSYQHSIGAKDASEATRKAKEWIHKNKPGPITNFSIEKDASESVELSENISIQYGKLKYTVQNVNTKDHTTHITFKDQNGDSHQTTALGASNQEVRQALVDYAQDQARKAMKKESVELSEAYKTKVVGKNLTVTTDSGELTIKMDSSMALNIAGFTIPKNKVEDFVEQFTEFYINTFKPKE